MLLGAAACTGSDTEIITPESGSESESQSQDGVLDEVLTQEGAEATPSSVSSDDAAPEEEATPAVPAVELPEVEVESVEVEDVEPEATTAASQPEATPEESATSEPEESQPQLDAEWSQDSDGNAVPDFLEEELGYDPLRDDCAPEMCSMAGSSPLTQEQNVLLILDASGSMAELVGSESRMAVAKRAIADYAALTSEFINLGFMVFGHQGDGTDAGKPASCEGIELLADLGEITEADVAGVLDQFEPTGWTPIGAALAEAEAVFNGRSGALNKVVLITDGLETCEGDPVLEAQRLNANPDILLTIDVVGFAIESAAEAAQLQEIAAAGGGEYIDAGTAEEMRAYFDRSAEEVFERFDFALCIVDNSLTYSVCSNKLLLDATFAIQREILDSDTVTAALFQSLIDQIALAKEDSDQRYDQFKSELDELLQRREALEQRREELFGND